MPNESLSTRLTRIEEKVDLLVRLNDRVAALERWQAMVVGGTLVVSVIFTIALAVIARG